MLTEVHKEILTFFRLCNLSTPTVQVTEDKDISLFLVEVTTTETEVFMDNNREFLFSFQSIFKRMIEKKYPNTPPFVIDINGEQKKYISEAKQKAHIAHQRVLQYEKPYEFGYLNGFERMIIHSFLKEKKDIRTRSQGIGKDRRLSVLPLTN